MTLTESFGAGKLTESARLVKAHSEYGFDQDHSRVGVANGGSPVDTSVWLR